MLTLTGQYDRIYHKSLEHAEKFWREAAEDIQWYRDYSKVLDDSNPPFNSWFTDGEINTCYNALDYHIAGGRAEQVALIYDSPVTNTIKKFTYSELLDEVSRFAGVLTANGISKGDRIVIYIPMIPEAAIAMLACARIGAIHSVVSDIFAANELAIRINDVSPKLIISASCGFDGSKLIEYKPLLDKAIKLATCKPDKCIIYQREQLRASMRDGRDYDWLELMKKAEPVGCARLRATDPLYILYTSGTTAMPKGVIRDNGSHAVALKWSMKNIYGMEPGEVWWAVSGIGQVLGHSYIIYGPLLYGCTTVMYEGKPNGTPDSGAFWRVISQHRVKSLLASPSTIRVIKKEDPYGDYINDYDLSSLGHLFLTGERTDLDTFYWAKHLLKVPVIDHWLQTETGWAITGICTGIKEFPARVGSAGKAMPGYQLEIIDSNGNTLPRESEGIIAIRLPLPPGALSTLWEGNQRYREVYLNQFPGYYITGDSGYIDIDGYLRITGRIDDIINTADQRLSTGATEKVLASATPM